MTVAGQLSEYLGLLGCDAEKRLAALRPRVRCGREMLRDRSRWPATPPPNSGKNTTFLLQNACEAVVRCGGDVACGRRPHPLLGLKQSTSSLGS